ncbi:MAG: hypothetical protein J7574_12005 [Flavobacterium sp.]|uniref:hypothetical protein n=1 Tax=Flavobacterium sp. TaxID=239 RepID=UPI001B16ADB0|nr:hypothetical protein [Flavobacterium sp.]MBO9584873.1 hypothetical protein [Flavobacterium sp.]
MSTFKFLLSLGALLLLLSCQNESDVQDDNRQGTIVNTSPLTTYLQRVAMVSTVQDNIIDGSTYCTIKFPYTVTVNSQKIAINSASDYQKVADNINASNTDNDVVTIDFPVTMIYYNYYQTVIATESDFNSLIDYWNKFPDLLAKINGLNINYPIRINIYNSLNQSASSETIASDHAFYDFIKNLNGSTYISLQYPISVVDYNNKTNVISNNLEFENAIKYAIDYCPENNIATLDFAATITQGSWGIPYFFDVTEKTSLYNSYLFVFKSDKSVVATKAGVSEIGQWDSSVQNGTTELKLNFSSDLLSKLNKNWKLFEFNNSQVRLRDVSNGTNYLYFEKK